VKGAFGSKSDEKESSDPGAEPTRNARGEASHRDVVRLLCTRSSSRTKPPRLMNIITGVFVESAIEVVGNDRIEATRIEMQRETSNYAQLKSIFKQFDSDNSGQLDFKEFQLLLKDDTTRLLLKRLGLDVNGARGVFRLIDFEGKGQVDLVEFLVSCMRLKGDAKAVDLATLMFECNKMRRDIQAVSGMVHSVHELVTSQQISNRNNGFAPPMHIPRSLWHVRGSLGNELSKRTTGESSGTISINRSTISHSDADTAKSGGLKL